MNINSFSGIAERLRYSITFRSRLLTSNTKAAAFSPGGRGSIQRIYVINLDRQRDRWHHVGRELSRLRAGSGDPLTSLTRRFSAIDARYREGRPDDSLLQPQYSFADHLTVEPNPLQGADLEPRDIRIDMTSQEIAVALSHIAVWKLIVASGVSYTLVLEDDVYFPRGFARSVDKAWIELADREIGGEAVDLVYLSFKEVGRQIGSGQTLQMLRRPTRGLWQLSGYVLSQSGAQKLIDLLPVRGPIDLWMNLQFGNLHVLTTPRPIIDQRRGIPSTNSYSVMPILSQVGAWTRDAPILPAERNLPSPVFAIGDEGSGLTALGTALSMLGYRCCGDLSELPLAEAANLFASRRKRAFNAYVNIGSIGLNELAKLATLYGDARFIVTKHTGNDGDVPPVTDHAGSDVSPLEIGRGLAGRALISLERWAPGRILTLPATHPDKWDLLSQFLECEYPSHRYPNRQDVGQRRLVARPNEHEGPTTTGERRRFDRSPWIVPLASWAGIRLAGDDGIHTNSLITAAWSDDSRLDEVRWFLREDTFPSNLALFSPHNCTIDGDNIATLTLRPQKTDVRSFTSAAIASRNRHLHGHFAAELRPPKVSGLITGIFLHRNGPRQEVDIELLGRDTTKILVNVYYNPGDEGAKLEFGYRGTPTFIDLGFDAADDFHLYEIEWRRDVIRWLVDGELIHERIEWNPTPIPDLPLQFNVNLWHSRSRELAGSLNVGDLPASAVVKRIYVASSQQALSSSGT